MIKTVWCITFYVSDLEKAKRFYEKTLGLEKKYEYSSYVGFECGGVEIGLIPKLEKGQKVGPLSPPVEFIVDDVERVYNELKQKGVNFVKELHEEPWGGKQATFTDPDGNVL
jgi:catechol 2,3-dioxygenase-like lactoylglutathione lyase family enzyme